MSTDTTISSPADARPVAVWTPLGRASLFGDQPMGDLTYNGQAVTGPITFASACDLYPEFAVQRAFQGYCAACMQEDHDACSGDCPCCHEPRSFSILYSYPTWDRFYRGQRGMRVQAESVHHALELIRRGYGGYPPCPDAQIVRAREV